jgi:hypothetical protein
MLHLGDRLRGGEVHIGRFPAHRIKQPRFVAILRQGSELDSRAVRRQTSYHPAAMEAHTGIRHANGTLHEFVAINFRGTGFLGPNPCRKPNGLRVPGDERSPPSGQGENPGCPRLPSPAILLFNRWPSRADGSELSSSLRTSSGGLAVYGARCSSLFQNCTGSRSLPRASKRSQRCSSARIKALPPTARASR